MFNKQILKIVYIIIPITGICMALVSMLPRA